MTDHSPEEPASVRVFLLDDHEVVRRGCATSWSPSRA
jgi:hypothetical protein